MNKLIAEDPEARQSINTLIQLIAELRSKVALVNETTDFLFIELNKLKGGSPESDPAVMERISFRPFGARCNQMGFYIYVDDEFKGTFHEQVAGVWVSDVVPYVTPDPVTIQNFIVDWIKREVLS